MSSDTNKQPARRQPRRQLRVFKAFEGVGIPEHCCSCHWWFPDEHSGQQPAADGVCDYSQHDTIPTDHLNRCSKWEPIRPTHLEYEDTVLIDWKDGATPQG